jgi:hypothetical protein
MEDLETEIAKLKERHADEVKSKAEWEAREKASLDAFDYAMSLIADDPYEVHEVSNIKAFPRKRDDFWSHVAVMSRGYPKHMIWSVKKVIGGISYNTKTATLLGHGGVLFLSNLLDGQGLGFDSDIEESGCMIYGTKSGEFFCVYGFMGNPDCCVSVIKKYMRYSGIRFSDPSIQMLIIIPFTKAEAVRWLQIMGYPEEKIALTLSEPEMKQQAANLRIPPNLMSRIDAAAEAAGMSRNEWLMRAAEMALDFGLGEYVLSEDGMMKGIEDRSE